MASAGMKVTVKRGPAAVTAGLLKVLAKLKKHEKMPKRVVQNGVVMGKARKLWTLNQH